jgi:hypothetical protein
VREGVMPEVLSSVASVSFGETRNTIEEIYNLLIY